MFIQFLFFLALFLASFLIYRRVQSIKNAISLGRPLDRTDQKSLRLKTMLLVAFGQKKMFRKPIVGLLHFMVYAGFIIINIELLEIIADGLTGSHRLFLKPLGSFYPVLINTFEVLALLVIIACAIFLIRRNILKVPRFNSKIYPEMKNWPTLDGNLILIFEIMLMSAFLKMDAADQVLQARGVEPFASALTGKLAISQFLIPIMDGYSDTFLLFVEQSAWWFHILGILFFAVYVTYSKHLHIVLAFPNTYFSNLNPKGEMENMPTVQKEVSIMLGTAQPDANQGEVPRFGAKDVKDLTWKNLLDAYSCTECGRCSASCPASMTGKKLSPREIMMATRDRLEDIQKGWNTNGPDFMDEKTLFGDYISEEEILACTTCNACVEECPILISPLDIILQLRRYSVMEESKAPSSWNMMFQNLETNMAPWKFSPDDRLNWAKEQ